MNHKKIKEWVTKIGNGILFFLSAFVFSAPDSLKTVSIPNQPPNSNTDVIITTKKRDGDMETAQAVVPILEQTAGIRISGATGSIIGIQTYAIPGEVVTLQPHINPQQNTEVAKH